MREIDLISVYIASGVVMFFLCGSLCIKCRRTKHHKFSTDVDVGPTPVKLSDFKEPIDFYMKSFKCNSISCNTDSDLEHVDIQEVVSKDVACVVPSDSITQNYIESMVQDYIEIHGDSVEFVREKYNNFRDKIDIARIKHDLV
jgi:hypothetical protein